MDFEIDEGILLDMMWDDYLDEIAKDYYNQDDDKNNNGEDLGEIPF